MQDALETEIALYYDLTEKNRNSRKVILSQIIMSVLGSFNWFTQKFLVSNTLYVM